MAEQYDFSDFDATTAESPEQKAEDYDFSDFNTEGSDRADSQVAAQVEEQSSPDTAKTPNVSDTGANSAPPAPEAFQTLQNTNNALTKTGVGAAGGYSAGKGVQGLQEFIKEATPTRFLGPLQAQDINFIAEDPTRYNQAAKLEDTLNQYRNLGNEMRDRRVGQTKQYTDALQDTVKGVNQAAYDLPAQAKASLQGLPNIPKEDLYKSFANALNSSKGLLSEVPPEEQSKMIQDYLAKNSKKLEPATNKISSIDGEIRQIQDQISQFRPEDDLTQRLALEKQLKQKIAQKNASEKALANTSEMLQKEAQNSVGASNRIPKEILDANPALVGKRLPEDAARSLQNALGMVNDMPTISPSNVADEQGLINKLRDGVQYGQPGTSTDNKLDKRFAETVRQDFGAKNPEYDAKQKLGSKAIGTQDELAKLGIKLSDDGTPVMSPAARANVTKWLDDPTKHSDELERLTSALKNAQSVGVNAPEGFGDIPALQEVENRFAATGVKPNTQTGDVEFPQSKQNSFVENLVVGGDTDEIKNAKMALEGANKQLGVPKANPFENFQNQVKAGNIKNTVAAGNIGEGAKRNLRRAGAGGVGATIGGIAGGGDPMAALAGAGIGVGLESQAAKLQEMLAKLKGSKAGQMAGNAADFLGRNAPKAGLLLGALGGAASAQAQGLNPAETAISAAGEAVNPIPFTDVASGIKAVKDLPPEDVNTWENNPNSLTGAGPDTGAIPAAFLKGATSTVPAGLQSAGESIDKFGAGQSNDARSRMEQNLSAYRNLSKPKVEPDDMAKQHQSFQALEGPELQQLAADLQAEGNSYAAPIMEAAQTENPQKKSAILFGLYQQPAFRQMYKMKKPQ